jgi:hypothetical protein
MITLCIRYTFDASKVQDYKKYAEVEQPVIERCGGTIVGYFGPTEFAGATNEALGLIELPSVAAYARYRDMLDNDPEHKANVERLTRSGAQVSIHRSLLERIAPAHSA